MGQLDFNWDRYSGILGKRGLDWLTGGNYVFTPYNDPQKEGVFQTDIAKDTSKDITKKLKETVGGAYDRVLESKDQEWMVTDAFKTFYNGKNKLKITPDRYWWHHLTTKMNNHLLKLVTKEHKGYSYIAMKAIIERIIKTLDIMPQEDRDKMIDNANNAIANGQKPDLDSLEKAIQLGLNKAKKDIKNAEENFGKNAGKGLKDDLDLCEIAIDPEISKALTVNRHEINKFVKHVADRAIEATYGIPEVIEESFFDSDTADVDDIINIEDFSHAALLGDVSVRRKRYSINFDIYLDDSGSMHTNINIGGKYIKMSTLARILGLKLHLMGLVKDIYLFSNDIKKVTIGELFKFRWGGGTNIERCIKNAKQLKRASIIITDGWDKINTYYDKCYFIGLGMNQTSDSFIPYAKKGKFHFYNDGKFLESVIVTEKNAYGENTYVQAKGT
jgi:hypothetical protein